MANFKCILIGDGLLLAQCGEILANAGHEILAVVTANPAVRNWASTRAMPVVDHDMDYGARVADLDFDWLFSISNLKIVPEVAWRRAKAGAVNFHDGPLPAYAGLNTPSWAIMAGETRHAVTWHEITAGIDEGAIYAQQFFDVAEDETALSLNAKCFEAGMTAFQGLVRDIETAALRPVPQDFSTRIYYGREKRPHAAGTLSFNRPAADLDRLVRALDFGADRDNTLVTAKVRAGEHLLSVARLEVLDTPVLDAPGTVISRDATSAVIAAADRAVRVEFADEDLDIRVILWSGMVLEEPDAAFASTLSHAVEAAARHENWFRKAIASVTDVTLPQIGGYMSARAAAAVSLDLALPQQLTPTRAAAIVSAFIGRLSKREAFSVAFGDDGVRALCDSFAGYFADAVPVTVSASAIASKSEFIDGIEDAVNQVSRRGAYCLDLTRRYPGLKRPSLTFGIDLSSEPSPTGIDGCALTFAVGEGNARLIYDRNRIGDDQVQKLADRFAVFAAAFDNAHSLADLPIMSEQERHEVLFGWNDTTRPYDRDACVHDLIERQVRLTPDAVALAFQSHSLTYAEMDRWAEAVAAVLVAEGVGPDVLVGLHMPRSAELVVAAYAIHKAGGAYVPLDPAFPAERLAYMVRDSGVKLVIGLRGAVNETLLQDCRVLFIDDIAPAGPTGVVRDRKVRPENLAYVIYTSGSTGNPKGVMVEHGNVVNFFAGMDDRISCDSERQNVWLAVTSLSFDISVLELFWTLSRGFKVVIHASEVSAGKKSGRAAKSSKALDFGLFYWGNDSGSQAGKYDLLLRGAKFADQHGFQAVWTPERHFHAFGGPYPNPAVTGAAVAAVTENVSIRAGSCVLPLHHPLRVAEEWAVVDNLSGGRVAVAFASGWMPEDFVLRPENAPPRNKASMVNDIEVVRKLWRGESVEYSFGSGSAAVLTQPRPVQKELPVWLTTAGNPDTYREAARLGANVLTHLLGQSIDELAEKIRIYRETLVECGRNPDDHKVTLMLHTLLGEDREEVRDLARGPMKEYLKSAAALIKQYAWAFPAFKKPQGLATPADIDLQSLSAEELDAILEFAFLRYFEDSGLFGTIEDAHVRLAQAATAGVDEIACLIDFGVADAVVLDRLQPLAQLVKENRHPVAEPLAAIGFAEEVRRHGVTHFQCTPSMARMFMISDEDRRAFAGLSQIFIGGEALHGSLLEEIARETTASVTNMYGPTETTIWSATCRAQPTDGIVPLGEPIANTQLYVLDANLSPVPLGADGELFIGGDGVTRGYLNRPELTAERFLPNPFAEGRIYRTGDVVSMTAQRQLLFLGRVDHQVKVRGYRIELGEIEACANAFAGVEETVVLAREDQPGDIRIVAYIRTTAVGVDQKQLTAYLATKLPDYMVPSHIVDMDAFPLTPNAKVDRGKLPAPNAQVARVSGAAFVAPADALQTSIADAFKRVLGVERVGIADNFFALGGHSLLAVQVHRDLKASIAPDLAITDLFRFPTVGQLAEFIADRGKSEQHLAKVADRAAMRRNAMGERRREFQRS